MLGKIEGRRKRGQQRMRLLDGITDSMDVGLDGLIPKITALFNDIKNQKQFTPKSKVENSNGFASTQVWFLVNPAWASLVAQTVNNLLAMQEAQI